MQADDRSEHEEPQGTDWVGHRGRAYDAGPDGACGHLVPRSRTGARMPTTFRPARSGRGSHCLRSWSPRKVLARRPAIEPGTSWGVGHGSRHGRCVEEVRHRRSRVSVTSRVTGSFGQQAWWTVGAAGLIQTFIRASIALRYRRAISHFRSGVVSPHRPARTFGGGVRPAHDPALIEVVLHDARGHRQVGVTLDCPREPVDVRRFERRDLVEPVAVELAERDDIGLGLLERGARRRPKPTNAVPLERSGRVRCAQRLAARPIAPRRRLAGQRRGARRRRVPRPERLAGVDPPGHGPSRLRTRWAATTRWRTLELDVDITRPGGPVPFRASARVSDRVGVVDLRHQARRHP